MYSLFIFIHNGNVFFYSLCDRDIDKKDNLGGDRQVDDIRAFVKNEFVFGINAATIDAKWEVFQRTFSERATEYMNQWMEKRFCVFHFGVLSILACVSSCCTLSLSNSTSGRSGVVPGGLKCLAQEKLAILRQKQIMRYSK